MCYSNQSSFKEFELKKFTLKNTIAKMFCVLCDKRVNTKSQKAVIEETNEGTFIIFCKKCKKTHLDPYKKERGYEN